MRNFLFFLLLAVAFTEPASAQLFQHDSSSTHFERFEYVIGSSVAFSLLDYVAFNFSKEYLGVRPGEFSNTIYHGIFFLVGAGINYWLYHSLGLPSAIAFDVIWWSWADDLGYMAWANILNPSSPWPNRSTEQFTENICCAEWTPVGLVQGYKAFLPRSTIFAQSAIGLSLAIAILW